MRRIRITGLVALANRVRRTLAGPVSAKDVARLQASVARSLQTVEQILAESHARPEDLPSQSRKAYCFLKEIDFDKVPVNGPSAGSATHAGEVRFAGLRRFLESILHRLAKASGDGVDPISDTICRSSRNLEDQIARAQLQPEQLTAETRQIRGWLAFFSDRSNVASYLAAVELARGVFEHAFAATRRHSSPGVIHFRPMQGLARIRGYRNGTRVSMPTPMIYFGRDLFETLAGLLLRREPNRQPILEAMAAEPYQDIQAELEALGGVVELTAGMAHDLALAFDRVNKVYFDGRMDRPHLTWNRTFTRSKFGHYDPVRDTVMVSATLDRVSAPEFVVDFIMYHELLHKKLGIDWRNSRARVHTAAFREQERRFARHEEAETVLNGLAKGINP